MTNIILFHCNLDRDPLELDRKDYFSFLTPELLSVVTDRIADSATYCDYEIARLEREELNHSPRIFSELYILPRDRVLATTLKTLLREKHKSPILEMIYQAYLNNDLWYQRHED